VIEDVTPQNADRLDKVLEQQQWAETGTLAHLKAYSSLLRASVARPAAAPVRYRQRFMFKLEFPDGRWDVAERQLGAEPSVGDELRFAGDQTWRVRSTQVVGPGRAQKPPRNVFVCVVAA
jgi:hypothetical protein